MKYLIACVVFFLLSCTARLCAQEITLDLKAVMLEEAFSKLKQEYGLHFVYLETTLAGLPKVSIRVRSVTVMEVMDALLRDMPLTYIIHNRVVSIMRKEEEKLLPVPLTISGYVYNAQTQLPVPRAGIRFVGAHGEAVTSVDGLFEVRVPPGTTALQWTAVGYSTYTVPITGPGPYQIALQPIVVDIDEVVVTGIVDRDRASYTSATTTISGADIRKLTNSNAVEALATLDPAFMLIANNLRGSDPGLMPQIELRGKTSLSGLALESELGIDPNLPLFVLDGFESSLEQIVNLDIHRIASITLLKDAASAALYGARSANGVVVVETRKPTEGKLTFNYRADIGVEVGDISDYNMMNSLEKVEFEQLAGRYDPQGQSENPAALSSTYNERKKNALRGQSFNWLKVPLQNGFSTNHSAFLQGGNARWQYAAGGNRRNREGVMRGSGKTTWGGWADLAFRKGKLVVYGKSFVNGYDHYDSPTNKFSAYVKQSPLYTPLDTGRFLDEIPFRDQYGYYREPNYVYDAGLNSSIRNDSWYVQQNVSVDWGLSPGWTLSARIQTGYQSTSARQFISPKDSRFFETAVNQRGSYELSQTRNFSYQGNIMATWDTHIVEKHEITVNVRGEIQQIDVNNRGYMLRGFPMETSGHPSEAFQPLPDGRPRAPSPPTIRRVNGLVSGNYSFEKRYFLDATLRIDGSTQFGSAERYAAFWSAGVGWNVHNESFMDNLPFVDLLRLRVNTGLTGNQSFGSFLSTVVYEPLDQSNEGAGILHASLGNPFLRWQSTRQRSAGIDVNLWGGRVGIAGNWYVKYTNPLIGVVDMPPSTGVSDYAMNVGALKTRGMEALVRFSPIYRPAQSISWALGITFSKNRSVYADLANELLMLNEEMLNNQSLNQYVNGKGPDDLWAVRSLGIEPNTGREIFLTQNGQHTFDYNLANVVIVGSARPWADGVISTVFNYKRISVGAYFRYSLGRSVLNDALYQKVENIDFDGLSANQDVRALNDRWKEPGDQARFRGISLLEHTPISSRFIQRESLFSGESMSLGYTLDAVNTRFLHGWGIQQISVMAYANSFLRLSNLLAERGTEYPFSRTYSISLGLIL